MIVAFSKQLLGVQLQTSILSGFCCVGGSQLCRAAATHHHHHAFVGATKQESCKEINKVICASPKPSVQGINICSK